MAVLALLFVLVQSLVQYPRPAGDGLDEATQQRMQERRQLLEHEMARLLQELEQGPLEQQDEGWGSLLFGALQQWPFWALAGVLLLLGLWLSQRRRSREGKSSGKDLSSWKTVGEEEGKEHEEDPFDPKEDGEDIDVTVETDDSSTGSECGGSPVSANEGEGVDVSEGNEDGKINKDGEVRSEEGHDSQKDEGGSDENVWGGDSVEENDEEGGSVAGNTEGPDEASEGENEDVKAEEEKDAGKEEGPDGNEERDAVNMKAGNNVILNEGEYEVDGKEEDMIVKVQESSEASEQSRRDWTGQENESDGGKAIGHSGLATTEEENTDLGNEETSVSNKDPENGTVNAKGEKNEEGKEEPGDVAANENEGSDGNKEVAGSGERQEEDEEAHDTGKKRGILLVDRIQGPVEELESGCSVTAELMESLRRVFAESMSNSFYPVPEGALGVGSAFEGWSPSERDVVYCVLVPLSPPLGHAFHLEQESAGQMAGRTFSVRVELECMCRREQLGEKVLCFLHHSEEKLGQKQEPSLLETLCTSSYLDVEKTSRWFYEMVRSSWLHLPESQSWHVVFERWSRCCRLRLSKGQKSLTVEMLFGVRRGDSDIFVVSQSPEAQKGISVSSQPTKADFISSTMWPETFAVAEAKFLQHISRQVPCKALHLKCLQVFTCILRGTGFSISTWKTVVMHVLTTVPLSRWRQRQFERRLWDVMAYLHRCLQSNHLEHFVLSTKSLPAEISVPPEMRGVEPLNLFEHLARDPAAHAEAMRAYGQLRLRLWVLLSSH